MAAYAAGDAAAFERLFGALAPRVLAFFVRSLGDRAVAEDLLQQTFLKLHRNRTSYDPTRGARPWIFTIAARLRADELRRRGRSREDSDEAPEDRGAGAVAAEFAAQRQSAASSEGRAAAVQEALVQLSERQRTILHLHRFEGLTFAEIGESLGLSEGAVKLRAFRAYERLRTLLRPLLAEGEE